MSVMYIRGGSEEAALKELQDMISEHENTYPDAAVIILRLKTKPVTVRTSNT